MRVLRSFNFAVVASVVLYLGVGVDGEYLELTSWSLADVF